MFRGIRDRRRFLRWARTRVVPLVPFDGARLDVDRLSVLDPLLEGKRVASIGELDHFVHERTGFRLLMARYLASRGFEVLGEELSWSDGLRVGRYLETGDASWLDRVSTYGYRGDARRDRDDAPTGVLKESFARYPEALFAAEQRRFARALRAAGPGESPRHFFGFDVDYNPGGGYADVAGAGLPASLPVARVPGESLEDEVARLGRVLEGLGASVSGDTRTSLRTLRDSLAYVRLAHPARSWEELRPSLALRERVMQRHLEYVLGERHPGARVALMAHALHLAKDDGGILQPGPGPGGGRTRSLGHVLHHDLAPGSCFSVWMLFAEGEDSQPYVPGRNRLRAPRRSLNALLAKLGDVFLLPLGEPDPEGLLDSPQEILQMYGGTLQAVPRQQADALLFVRRVTPLREEEPRGHPSTPAA